MTAPTRRPARERREAIIGAALIEFADNGMHATTEAIAQRAGITQPYVYRFFRTKTELLAAVIERCFDQVQDAFTQALRDVPAYDPQARLTAMGEAYAALVADRTLLLAQLQGYAACREEALRGVVRRRLEDLLTLIERESGAGPDIAHMFTAHGMLLTVAAAAGTDAIPIRPAWADSLTRPNAEEKP